MTIISLKLKKQQVSRNMIQNSPKCVMCENLLILKMILIRIFGQINEIDT